MRLNTAIVARTRKPPAEASKRVSTSPSVHDALEAEQLLRRNHATREAAVLPAPTGLQRETQ
jgi:hypothetical protein